MDEETSFTSFDSRAMPAKQWSTASARSPPELARSPIFAISSCMAVTKVRRALYHSTAICKSLPTASCWKCLKKASLGVSCSACCSTIVAADAAIEGVANAGAALVLHSKLAAVWILRSPCATRGGSVKGASEFYRLIEHFLGVV